MLKTIGSIIGWIGTALVIGAVGVRLFRPEWNQYAHYAAWAGLACVVVYMATQWREIADSFSSRQLNRPPISANATAPTTPNAADSVGVARPA